MTGQVTVQQVQWGVTGTLLLTATSGLSSYSQIAQLAPGLSPTCCHFLDGSTLIVLAKVALQPPGLP